MQAIPDYSGYLPRVQGGDPFRTCIWVLWMRYNSKIEACGPSRNPAELKRAESCPGGAAACLLVRGGYAKPKCHLMLQHAMLYRVATCSTMMQHVCAYAKHRREVVELLPVRLEEHQKLRRAANRLAMPTLVRQSQDGVRCCNMVTNMYRRRRPCLRPVSPLEAQFAATTAMTAIHERGTTRMDPVRLATACLPMGTQSASAHLDPSAGRLEQRHGDLE